MLFKADPFLSLFLIPDTSVFRGGGSPAQRDGCDGPGLRGHAGAEQPLVAAAPGEGRRQLQADERADQIQPDLQAAEGGEGGVGRPSAHIQNPGDEPLLDPRAAESLAVSRHLIIPRVRHSAGRRPAVGCAEAGGEGGNPAERPGCSGEGAVGPDASSGTQQEEGVKRNAISHLVSSCI